LLNINAGAGALNDDMARSGVAPSGGLFVRSGSLHIGKALLTLALILEMAGSAHDDGE
jgi:hypothetical protein